MLSHLAEDAARARSGTRPARPGRMARGPRGRAPRGPRPGRDAAPGLRRGPGGRRGRRRVPRAPARRDARRDRLSGAGLLARALRGGDGARRPARHRARARRATSSAPTPANGRSAPFASRTARCPRRSLADRAALDERGAAIAGALVAVGIEDRRDALRRALVRAHRAHRAAGGARCRETSRRWRAPTRWPSGRGSSWPRQPAPRGGPTAASRRLDERGGGRHRAADRSGARARRSSSTASSSARGGSRRAPGSRERGSARRRPRRVTLEEALSALAAAGADLDRLEALARAAAPRDFKLAGPGEGLRPSAPAAPRPGLRIGRSSAPPAPASSWVAAPPTTTRSPSTSPARTTCGCTPRTGAARTSSWPSRKGPPARPISSSRRRTWRRTSRTHATSASSTSSTRPRRYLGNPAAARPAWCSSTAKRSSSCAGTTSCCAAARGRDPARQSLRQRSPRPLPQVRAQVRDGLLSLGKDRREGLEYMEHLGPHLAGHVDPRGAAPWPRSAACRRAGSPSRPPASAGAAARSRSP